MNGVNAITCMPTTSCIHRTDPVLQQWKSSVHIDYGYTTCIMGCYMIYNDSECLDSAKCCYYHTTLFGKGTEPFGVTGSCYKWVWLFLNPQISVLHFMTPPPQVSPLFNVPPTSGRVPPYAGWRGFVCPYKELTLLVTRFGVIVELSSDIQSFVHFSLNCFFPTVTEGIESSKRCSTRFKRWVLISPLEEVATGLFSLFLGHM